MTRKHITRLLAATLGAFLSSGAAAQDLGVKAPAQTKPVIIDNATIHTVSGAVIERGHIVFDNGRITRVSTGRAPGVGGVDAIVIDASGKHVYPGLIGPNTLMGLIEIESIRVTQDYTEMGAITPEARAAVAVNPDSTIIPVTRSNGVLTAAVLPMGGVMPGRAAVLRMEGWTWEDMAIEPDAGLMINWPSMRTFRSRWMQTSEEDQRKQTRQNIQRIDDACNASEAYFASRDADAAIGEDLRYAGMKPVLDGSKPVFIRANQVEQIESAVLWAVGRGLKPVIVGGADADKCADLLKKHDVGVIITGTHTEPARRDDPYDDSFTRPARLDAAGIRWCLGTTGGSFETAHERNLPYHAATAVAYGLDRDKALRGITLSAAEILGVADELGSLDLGKRATLIITDGDPLEITTNVEMAFIDGRAIDLENKQTALAKKYREKYRQLGLIGDEASSEAPTTTGSGASNSR